VPLESAELDLAVEGCRHADFAFGCAHLDFASFLSKAASNATVLGEKFSLEGWLP
jgi:hypothetical protein